MKKCENCDIILYEMRWDTMNHNVLISTAMLNALWENKHTDALDLLIPFLRYAIAKTTNKGDIIDVGKVTNCFKDEYGYDDIPIGVIETMMNRLSPRTLLKSNKNYRLIVDLDNDCKEFEKKKTLYREQCDSVVTELRNYLNNSIIGAHYDDVSTLKALIDFFVANGICLVKDTQLLQALKSKESRINYMIAQFILQEKKNNTVVFDYLSNMVGGFFVSTAISLQPHNNNLIKSKYKELTCFLDTRIILCALGLHLPEENQSSQELIKMIRAEKATIKCFEHTFDEINDIICAYKASLQNPQWNKSMHTLEAWDELKYSVSDVDSYLLNLRRRIENLGIEIVPRPVYETNNCDFDERALRDNLDSNILYRNKEGLTKDVDSISAVFRLRAGRYNYEIERARYIFVTTNIKLEHYTNRFFANQISNKTPIIITDTYLASITWLKSYSANKEYPQIKLLSHALASIEPSAALISTFLDKVDKIKSEGGLTEDEAAIIRSDLFCRREAVRLTMGEPEAVTEQTVYDIKKKLIETYAGTETKKAEVNYGKYREALEQRNQPIRNALRDIEQTRETAKTISRRILSVLLIVIGSLLLLAFVARLVFVCIQNIQSIPTNVFLTILSIFGVVIDAAACFDFFINKKSLIKRFIGKVSHSIAANASDRIVKKYQKIFPNLSVYDPE